MKTVLYIHGKGGSADESAHYEKLFPGWAVKGLDYRTFTPWETGPEIRAAVEALRKQGEVVLIANSIGAYFCLHAGLNGLVEKAYFISPVVDMEKLIEGMMAQAGVGEEELEARGVVSTPFGEELSWEYLRYVRSHPVDWRVKTHILYGGRDMLTSRRTVSDFASSHGATLTVMEDGEHWFHTAEQMRFLDDWIIKRERTDAMDITFRRETPDDHRAVENLVREAFWNVYRPGCSEHYVLHCLRSDPAFVPELDIVMEQDGELIGQIVFVRAAVTKDGGGELPVLTMGPICVKPELKRRGYGKLLLDHALEQAAALGFGAVCIEGNVAFYGRSGFTFARSFGLRYHGLPEGMDDSFFLCRELIPGYLDGVRGEYATPEGYMAAEADPEGFEAFDAQFPPREKLRLPGQLV